MTKPEFANEKVEAVLSISILREKSIIDLKPRSGECPPINSPFGGMTDSGWGSVCCLTDLTTNELIKFKEYLENLIIKRSKL